MTTVTTWRDIADELTPEQINELELWEAQYPTEQAGLLLEARGYAEENLTSAVMFPHVDRPIGSTKVFGWSEHAGQWSREFEGSEWEHGGDRDLAVTITGYQFADGSTRRFAKVYSTERCQHTADELRSIAATLVQAADEIDQLQRTESRP